MATAPFSIALLLLVATLPHSSATTPPSSPPCPPQKLAAYRVLLRTFWTRDLFPKHYPDWRPSAQWSRLIGRSHGASFVLFRLGATASPGVQALAEAGLTDALDEQGQGGTVLDAFSAPAIRSGAGHAEATFFVDGNHSRVSMMARIIPSPDWFIGIDSFDLCANGNWIDTVTIDGDPLDAGTDNGFTFTAPNWATSPQGVIYRLTSAYPSHPAGSFFYPNLKRLPPIATFQFIKVREYDLGEEFHPVEEEERPPLQKRMPGSGGREEDEQERNPFSLLPTTNNTLEGKENRTRSTAVLSATAVPAGGDMTLVPKGDKNAIVNSIVEKYHQPGGSRGAKWGRLPLAPQQRNGSHVMVLDVHKGMAPRGQKMRKKFRRNRPPRDCHVTDWSEWGACSKSCGIGEMQRRRQVVRHARRGGSICPPLLETKWCGSAKPCAKAYFQW
ncbi:spondin-2 [Hetaerina americana]|uniref:spondin-2 n=1 Tax=Hetaerina americana TaxID=62018 RepID=UPI003A7F1DA1